MSSLDMLDLIGGIDTAYISESFKETTSRKTISVQRWLPALAACAALIMMIPVISNIFRNKGGYDGPSDGLKEIKSLEFNGCYYEATDVPEALTRYGLPQDLSPELAGEHVSYLVPNGAGYLESAVKTDIELLNYKPCPCRGVYIVNDQGHYYAAVFCNFFLMSDEASIDLSELYRIYGITGAESILSVTETNWHRNNTKGKLVTDRAAVEDFYQITCSLEPNSNSGFQAKVFDGVPEEEQQKKHIAFADDLHMIRIETASGLMFYIELYPNYEWVYAPGTLSYYPASQKLLSWAKENL